MAIKADYTRDGNQLDRIDSVLSNATTSGQIVGAVVAISHDGEVIYRSAVGLADREAKTPIALDNLFRWASLTKPVTTLAALVLADRGTIALRDPITKFLPDFTPPLPNGEPATITIWNLLTHTSGLTYGLFEPKDDGPYHRAGVSDGLDQPGLSIKENLRRLASVPLSSVPGSAWSYSLSTDVLGAAISEATHTPLPTLLEELVTGPLKMTETSFFVSDPDRLVTPYGDGPTGPIRMGEHHEVPFMGAGNVSFAPSRVFNAASYPSGGSGLVGTADDFLRLLESVRSGKVPGLSSESLRRLGTVETGNLQTFQPGWGWSLGWGVLADPTPTGTPQSPGTWLWGGVYGSSWFVDPARSLSVVALTNTGVAGMLGAFPDALRDAIYASLA